MNKIVVDNLSKKYNCNKVLTNASLQLNKGKVYALVGHNGAGKTTLIKHVIGILEPQGKCNGSIKYFEGNSEVLNYRKYISYSPEIYSLFEDLTIAEYLNFVANVYKCNQNNSANKIKNLLLYFELDDKHNRLIYTLSNGMKRKVSHIAALMINESFCFLDEPFSGLDPVAIFRLKTYMAEHLDNRSYIISTHQLAILDSFEIDQDKLDIILMSEGKLIYIGSKQGLLEKTKTQSIESAYLSFY